MAIGSAPEIGTVVRYFSHLKTEQERQGWYDMVRERYAVDKTVHYPKRMTKEELQECLNSLTGPYTES